MAKNTSKSDERTRNWTFLIYEDSVNKDYLEELGDLHIQCCISPWHDKDVWSAKDEKENPDHKQGTPKKKHAHVIVSFEGNKSFKQISELSSSIGGTIPKPIQSLSGMCRYLAHLDDPHKAQYNPKDIIVMGGMKIDDYLYGLSETAESEIYLNLLDLIFERDEDFTTDLYTFGKYIKENETRDVYKVFSKNTLKLNAVITSKRNHLKDMIEYGRYELDDDEQN